MSNYNLVIKTTDKARRKASEKNYKLVFAKGVSTGRDTEFNAAWMVLDPSEIGESITVNWTVNYEGNFSAESFKDGTEITISGNDLELTPGGQYNVDKNSTLIVDPNKKTQGNAFHFHNDAGYGAGKKEYTPIIKNPDKDGKSVPIWTATTGVTVRGHISATPVEVVRVWLGKYEAGEAVMAEYATVAVEFDLTEITSGKAQLSDYLDDWTDRSDNAKIVENFVSNIVFDELMPSLIQENESNPAPWVNILATFRYTLTVSAITYITTQLINKFAPNLRPQSILVQSGENKVEFRFRTNTQKWLDTVGTNAYVEAVNQALKKAQGECKDLANNNWIVKDVNLEVQYKNEE